ncbi:AEC family transporter [Aquitalea sp. LB_tupeE]|uniref:AEC family transporter n=1 Tax=Aquitalea sp. LB_tupeE TaxID=2748078 RepID=UPI0015BA7A58|nr:AEC family transporter [Aquitalea sp. LB_tupeE]
MLAIASITGPIFILIALGYWVTWRQWFAQANIRALGQFVITFALPAMIFRALTRQSFVEVVDLHYLLAYGLGSLLALGLGMLFARLVPGHDMRLSTLFGLGMSMSNSGFIGFPIVSQLLGAKAGIALAMTMLVENALVFPVVLILLESQDASGQGWPHLLRQVGGRLLRSPLVIAITAGVLCSLVGLQLPLVFSKVLELLAQASVALSLFVIGGSLMGLKTSGIVRRISPIVLGKLLLHPLLIFLLLHFLLPVPSWLQVAAVLFSCAPMMSIYPIMGQKYGHEGLCAATLLVATVTSFFSISGMLWLQG